MPPKRLSTNNGLPKRWRIKNGWYWYRPRENEKPLFKNKGEFPLGKTYASAMKTFSMRISVLDETENLQDILIKYRKVELPKKAYSTQKQREYSLVRLQKSMGHLLPHQITPQTAYQHMAKVAEVKSQKWANVDFETLSAALSFAVKQGDIEKNPVKGQVEKYALKGRKHAVSDDDLNAFIAYVPDKLKLYILLKLATKGRRKGELLRIRLDHLLVDGIAFVNNKDPDDRYILEWTDRIRDIVDQVKAIPPRRIGSAHLFLTARGKPFINDDTGETNAFNTLWTRWMTKAVDLGIVKDWFRENDLRAKSVENLSVEQTKNLLRHTTGNTTKKHYLTRERLRVEE